MIYALEVFYTSTHARWKQCSGVPCVSSHLQLRGGDFEATLDDLQAVIISTLKTAKHW